MEARTQKAFSALLIIFLVVTFYLAMTCFVPSLHYDSKRQIQFSLYNELCRLNTGNFHLNTGWDYIRLANAFKIVDQADNNRFRVHLILPIINKAELSKINTREIYLKLDQSPPSFGEYVLDMSLNDIEQTKKYLTKIYLKEKPAKVFLNPNKQQLDQFMTLRAAALFSNDSWTFLLVCCALIFALARWNILLVGLISTLFLALYVTKIMLVAYEYPLLLDVFKG